MSSVLITNVIVVFRVIIFTERVLNGNNEAAHLLAEAVHSNIDGCPVSESCLDIHVETNDCGIWIDPIGNCEHVVSCERATVL